MPRGIKHGDKRNQMTQSVKYQQMICGVAAEKKEMSSQLKVFYTC